MNCAKSNRRAKRKKTDRTDRAGKDIILAWRKKKIFFPLPAGGLSQQYGKRWWDTCPANFLSVLPSEDKEKC